jgi:cobalamin biosynthesis Mg chelatase CobN
MAKVNKQGPQKKEANTKAAEAQKPAAEAAQSSQLNTPKETINKGRQSGKSNRSRVGGTAVPGARSTQPKEINTSNPQQQQAESYNRTMRRRMEHLGTGPSEVSPIQEQRKKRLEKRKRRIEERKQTVKKVTASAPSNITLGRRNTYFLIAVAAIIVAIIVIALVLNHFSF